MTILKISTWLSFKAISAPYERVFPAEKDSEKDVEDNCKFMEFYSIFTTLRKRII